MINSYPNEKWKVLEFKSITGLSYAVSDYGRVASFRTNIEKGNLLGCGTNKGYKIFRSNFSKDGKNRSEAVYVHKLVAEKFIPKRTPSQIYVIHLNYVKDDNRVVNLRWASQEELNEHQKSNPRAVSDYKRLHKHNRLHHYKLSEPEVKVLKRKLLDPNRKTRIKMIALNFGVSEMQLYRIKRGENWGHVKP